jgi:hypothetical protein
VYCLHGVKSVGYLCAWHGVKSVGCLCLAWCEECRVSMDGMCLAWCEECRVSMPGMVCVTVGTDTNWSEYCQICLRFGYPFSINQQLFFLFPQIQFLLKIHLFGNVQCTMYINCDCRELSKNLLDKYQCMPTKQLLLERTSATFAARLKNYQPLFEFHQYQVREIHFPSCGLGSKTFVCASILSYPLGILSA